MRASTASSPPCRRARFRAAGSRQTSPALVPRVLREVAPDLRRMRRRRAWNPDSAAFAGRPGFLRQAYGPGWALVGDAGYFKDPLTAHGITDALRDAELLAEAAAADTEAAMAHYAATRDALSLPLFEATEAIAAFDWDLETLKLHHQALNRAMKREVEFLAAALRARRCRGEAVMTQRRCRCIPGRHPARARPATGSRRRAQPPDQHAGCRDVLRDDR